MAERGAPTGNQNAIKGKEWRDALRRALAHHSRIDMRKSLDDLATKVVDWAFEGQQWAVQEIACRMDGKPAQSISVTSEDGSSDLVEQLKAIAERLPV